MADAAPMIAECWRRQVNVSEPHDVPANRPSEREETPPVIWPSDRGLADVRPLHAGDEAALAAELEAARALREDAEA